MEIAVVLAADGRMQFITGHRKEVRKLCGHWECRFTRGLQESGASGIKVLLPVYTVHDEGLEENCAVLRFAGEFVDHSSRGQTRC